MKYIISLHESIRNELKLFKIKDISEASMKVMEIEEKNLSKKDKKGRKHANVTQKLLQSLQP